MADDPDLDDLPKSDQRSFQGTVNGFKRRHSKVFQYLWSNYDEKRRNKPFDKQSIPEDRTDKFYVPDQPIECYLKEEINQTDEDHELSFIRSMKSSQAFDNPSAIDNVKGGVFGLSCSVRPTLLECLLMKEVPESEYSEGLKYTQRNEWSMELTGTGIKHFKNGNTKKAKEYFDFALNVDHSNVECLVARGALQANMGSYDESIMDFDEAIDYNPSHKNACKYLVETCIAYGDSLLKIDNDEKALELYEKALSVDPLCEQAKTKVDEVSAIIRRQTVLKEEMERKKQEEEMRLKKLKKIIRREKRKMEEYDIHGPKPKSSKGHKKKYVISYGWNIACVCPVNCYRKKKSKGSHRKSSNAKKRRHYRSSSPSSSSNT